MFERFTESARQTIVVAQTEARAFGHPDIGTGHLLLGVLQADDGPARDVLHALGITRDDVREHLPQEGPPAGGRLPFSPEAKRVLERALQESLDLHAKFISPAHLLLGLTAESAGRARSILRDLGAAPGQVRQAMLLSLTAQRRRDPLPIPPRSFVEELTLALRKAEEMARREGRPVDACDLMLALGISPAAGYAIRVSNLSDAVDDARAGYGRLEQMRRDMRNAFASGELAEAERLRDDARRLRDELEGR